MQISNLITWAKLLETFHIFPECSVNPFQPSIALQIKWLVSICHETLGWNGLNSLYTEAY